MAQPSPVRDPERIAALRRTVLLDSPAEQAFDRLTLLATRILDAPVSLVSLVDQDRQFFKSCIGLPEPWATNRETPLSHSFCQHTVATGEPFVIEDARADPLVRANLAIRDLDVVAYAGIPLELDGQVLGSFCVIDSKPRAWSADDLEILRTLAESVMTEIRLRIAEGELRQAVRHRDDVLAMVSHDLRNPLGVILGIAEILQTHDLDDDRRHEQVEMVRRAADRMHRLVTDLLDLAGIEAGALRLVRTPVSVASLVEDAARHAARAAEEKGVELRVGVPDPDLTISADRDRLLQVLDNLLSNAIRFTPEGGPVELRGSPAADGDDDAAAEGAASIVVQDSGPGIDAEDLPRLFDRFYQAGQAGRGAAGLGLAIVKAVVDAHGGEVRVRSEPGQGAPFQVTLPAAG